MKYRVTIEGQEREIDVRERGDGSIGILVDGEPREADVVLVPGGANVRLDGKIFDVAIGGTPERTDLAAGDRRTVAEVLSARASAHRRRKAAGGGGGKEIRSPMPGRIVKILVGAGDEVEANQAVVVIEAMKMENELRAPGAGTVKSVEVEEGQNVEGNVLLVSFA